MKTHKMNIELGNYTVIVQGPPPNGSEDQLLKILKYYSRLLPVVYTSVSVELAHKIKEHIPTVICRVIDDVGPNAGVFKKPLNINRFTCGVKSSLQEVNTKNVLVLRSDIYLDLPALIASYELSEKRIGISSVTTKFFGIRQKWVNHVCDWYYIGTTMDIGLMMDCPAYPTNIQPHPSSLFPVSPEKFLWENYCRKIDKFSENRFIAMVNLLKLADITHPEEISLRCIKQGYENLPFGINKKEGITITQKQLDTWIYKNTFFFKIYSILAYVKSKTNA